MNAINCSTLGFAYVLWRHKSYMRRAHMSLTNSKRRTQSLHKQWNTLIRNATDVQVCASVYVSWCHSKRYTQIIHKLRRLREKAAKNTTMQWTRAIFQPWVCVNMFCDAIKSACTERACLPRCLLIIMFDLLLTCNLLEVLIQIITPKIIIEDFEYFLLAT